MDTREIVSSMPLYEVRIPALGDLWTVDGHISIYETISNLSRDNGDYLSLEVNMGEIVDIAEGKTRRQPARVSAGISIELEKPDSRHRCNRRLDRLTTGQFSREHWEAYDPLRAWR